MADQRSLMEFSRQLLLERQREKMMKDIQAQRQKIHETAQVNISTDKFVPQLLDNESQLKRETVGLVKLEEFTKIREANEKKPEDSGAQKEKPKKQSLVKKSKLSFDDDDEEEAAVEPVRVKKVKLGKDPNVDTSFLPDREREEQERALREKLGKEWLDMQSKIKDEDMEITYSFWDGSGHRHQTIIKKGDTIGAFIAKAKVQIPQIKNIPVDNLMFVKEDIIIPHRYTFYEFIVSKARGKSGPLFEFSAYEDIRLVNDATRETTEAHAGKIVQRSWYEKNKHIFPANRWEVYDPLKDYGKYTFKDPAMQ